MALVCRSTGSRRKKGRQGRSANVLYELKTNTNSDAIDENQLSGVTPVESPNDIPPTGYVKRSGLLNDGLVQSCAAYFYSRMLGTVPILHPDKFQEQVERMDECPHAYCLVVAFCAFVLTQTGYLSCHQGTGPDMGRALLDEAMAARRHLDPFSAPIRLGITIAFLLYGCHIGCGNQRQAYYFLREATTFYTADMLDQSGDEDEPCFSGNLFWLLLISERLAHNHTVHTYCPTFTDSKIVPMQSAGDVQ